MDVCHKRDIEDMDVCHERDIEDRTRLCRPKRALRAPWRTGHVPPTDAVWR